MHQKRPPLMCLYVVKPPQTICTWLRRRGSLPEGRNSSWSTCRLRLKGLLISQNSGRSNRRICCEMNATRQCRLSLGSWIEEFVIVNWIVMSFVDMGVVHSLQGLQRRCVFEIVELCPAKQLRLSFSSCFLPRQQKLPLRMSL